MDSPHPISVKAMLLCDGIAIDSVTGKTTIVGSMAGFQVDKFPAVLPPFAVYILFSEMTHRVRLELQIVNTDDEVIYQLPPAIAESPDPFTMIEFDSRFPDVNIDETGDYFIRLLADGVYIMDLRFDVSLEDSEE